MRLKSLEDSLRQKADDNWRFSSGLDMPDWRYNELDDSSADLWEKLRRMREEIDWF